MAIRYYDEALTEKIRKWVKDPNMKVLGPDETTRLFQMRADQQNDKPITLPMIAISRSNDIEIINTTKHALTYDGGHIANTAEKSEVLNGIPIKLSYQLDIYTRYFAEADEYMRNFVFNIINYPNIQIQIPYNNANVEHNSNIMLSSTVTDASSIQERLIAGQFTRFSIKLYIDDAYLFSVPFMDNWKVKYNGDEVKISDDEEGGLK